MLTALMIKTDAPVLQAAKETAPWTTATMSAIRDPAEMTVCGVKTQRTGIDTRKPDPGKDKLFIHPELMRLHSDDGNVELPKVADPKNP